MKPKTHCFLILTLFLSVLSSNVFAFNSYIDKDKYTASLSSTYDGFSIQDCFNHDLSDFCHSLSNGILTIDFDNISDVSNFLITNRSIARDRLSHMIVNDVDRYDLGSNSSYSFDLLSLVDIIRIYPVSDQALNLAEVSFDFLTSSTVTNNNNVNFCSGFSCWFATEEDFRDVFLALLLFLVVVFSLGYIGRIVRTGGDS